MRRTKTTLKAEQGGPRFKHASGLGFRAEAWSARRLVFLTMAACEEEGLVLGIMENDVFRV